MSDASAMSERYRINQPSVVSETIDGEAVIMDLRRGFYFSTRGIGAAIWSMIEHGEPLAGIADRLAAAFPDKAAEIPGAVEAFVGELLMQGLIASASPEQAGATVNGTPAGAPNLPAPNLPAPNLPAPNLPAPDFWAAVFEAPVLETYADMDDLLLLDPIHDVAETMGWPTRKPDRNDD
jgi:hypothetical protein